MEEIPAIASLILMVTGLYVFLHGFLAKARNGADKSEWRPPE